MTLSFELTQDAPETCAAPCVVAGVFEDGTLSAAAARVDEKSGGAIRRLFESGDVSGKLGATHLLFALAGIAAPRVLVVGLGAKSADVHIDDVGVAVRIHVPYLLGDQGACQNFPTAPGKE